ncbi:hypothetical protein [Polynucleobacter sp. IMCC 29146]|uniref:hypothetical protein n=1 Tax=Polynucleobacter sp. IMCC 29146 TaxID=2780953 RepID=UPI001F36F00B|nr:hypothetical protein [Polynucleobacter sp. IMCC 29146]MCE7530066.1 hypothetical protein [Polynucleobacter sp. IMCC 29146]
MLLIPVTSLKRKTRLLLLSGFLALALLGVQWLGFYHGIAHSGLGAETQISAAFQHAKQAGPIQSEQAKSSCHLFDALLLGGCLTTASFTFHLQQHDNNLPATVFISLAKPTAFWPYQSQAPPILNL